jgi:molybdate transport system ATP-binding protein
VRLDVHVVVRWPAFALDLPLVVEPGQVVALVGPNGAGKTTFLHAVAGLVDLAAGHVRLGDRLLDDAAAGIHVPTEDRRAGLVFQHHLLFPHLTALDNVAFGLRAHGMPRQQAHERARAWLDRLGVLEHAHRPATRLSGGQAQRVALARTLATEPDILLLDEPFAALDETARPRVRDLLRTEIFDDVRPIVLVTHDPTDAHTLADRVVTLPHRDRSAA